MESVAADMPERILAYIFSIQDPGFCLNLVTLKPIKIFVHQWFSNLP
jgi:hypothetical protein